MASFKTKYIRVYEETNVIIIRNLIFYMISLFEIKYDYPIKYVGKLWKTLNDPNSVVKYYSRKQKYIVGEIRVQ